MSPHTSLIRVQALAAIPFVLKDDDPLFRKDGAPLLPYPPDISDMKHYRDAYLEPVDDGGGSLDNNQVDVPFKLHIQPDPPDNSVAKYDEANLAAYDAYRQSKKNENPAFWVVYVCSAYQPETFSGKYGDEDPNSPETGVGAYTTPALGKSSLDKQLAVGGEGSLIFRETERELEIFDARKTHPKTVAHEIGHQFGLGHGQNGLMQEPLFGGSQLKPISIHFIRSRSTSPGQ